MGFSTGYAEGRGNHRAFVHDLGGEELRGIYFGSFLSGDVAGREDSVQHEKLIHYGYDICDIHILVKLNYLMSFVFCPNFDT